jgi:DNA repair exonuclease SbcCD ATPase subunit
VPQRLAESLRKVISGLVQEAENPYEIRCESEEEVNLVKEDINGFCAVLIKNWWLNTYDKMATEGKAIREELITDICNNIQMISDELSRHIGESLNIELNINPIQRLDFEFQGIDAQVERYTESYTRLKKEKRRAFCRDYEVDIPVDDRRSYYAIDLRKTIEAIKFEIDRQTLGSLTVVERAIKKQVAVDFRQAEKQIYEYIERFQQEFRRLLKERSSKEVEVDRVIAILEFQRDELYEYMEELKQIQNVLDSWQPSGVVV